MYRLLILLALAASCKPAATKLPSNSPADTMVADSVAVPLDTTTDPIAIPPSLSDTAPQASAGLRTTVLGATYQIPVGSTRVDSFVDTARTATNATIITRGTVTTVATVAVTRADTILPPAPALVGIPSGPYNVAPPTLTTGTLYVYAMSPSSALTQLAWAEAHGKQIVGVFSGGNHDNYKGRDGHWSYTLWKARAIDRWAAVPGLVTKINGYVARKVLIAHSLIDEPQCLACWWGYGVPWASVDLAAAASKQLFPALPALTRTNPATLCNVYPFRHLDGGMAQYSANSGDVVAFAKAQADAATRCNLVSITGINAENGGKVVTGCGRSYASPGKCNMSGAEVLTYGKALIASPTTYAWTWWGDAPFQAGWLARADVRSAMQALAPLLAAHARPAGVRR